MGMYVLETLVLKYILPDQYYDFPILVARSWNLVNTSRGIPQDLGPPENYKKAIVDFVSIRGQFLNGGNNGLAHSPW
jgi:hypothetical protein